MKFGLLLSDVTAILAGLVGLLLTFVLAGNTALSLFAKLPLPFMINFFATLFAFGSTASFLVPSLHSKMLSQTANGFPRAAIVVIGLAWISLVWGILVFFKSYQIVPFLENLNHDLVLAIATLFSVLFTLAFLIPGLAFAPYRVRQDASRELADGERTRIQKVYLFLWMVFAGCALTFGFVVLRATNFILEVSLFERVGTGVGVFIFVGTAVSFLLLIFSNNFKSTTPLLLRFLLSIGQLIMSGLIGVLAAIAVEEGLPAFLAQIASEPAAEREVTFQRYVSRDGSTFCQNSFEVLLPASGEPKTLCDLPPELLDRLILGEKLKLVGIETGLGFRYDSIERP